MSASGQGTVDHGQQYNVEYRRAQKQPSNLSHLLLDSLKSLANTSSVFVDRAFDQYRTVVIHGVLLEMVWLKPCSAESTDASGTLAAQNGKNGGIPESFPKHVASGALAALAVPGDGQPMRPGRVPVRGRGVFSTRFAGLPISDQSFAGCRHAGEGEGRTASLASGVLSGARVSQTLSLPIMALFPARMVCPGGAFLGNAV